MTAMTYLSEEQEAIDAAARDWAMRLFRAPHDAALTRRCETWRLRDPRHDAAFLQAERLWDAIGQSSAAAEQNWRSELEHLERTGGRGLRGWLAAVRWRIAVPVTLAAGLVLAVGASMVLRSPQYHWTTPKGQNQQVTLADGTHVFIGADSRIAVRFGGSSRHVDLSQGEAFFEVTHDPSRPFTVVAGDAEIQVTGTKFDVKRVNGKVLVAVQEGRVEVRRHSILPLVHQAAPERVLTAGELSQLSENSGFSPQVRANAASSWRAGRLSYSDASLADVIADANRYSSTPIRLASAQVGELRLTTSFRAEAVEQFVSNLAGSLPVKTSKAADGALVISALD